MAHSAPNPSRVGAAARGRRCGTAGPGVSPCLSFPSWVVVPPPLPPPGQGPSKKAAKHKAAEVALKLLKGGDMLEPGAPEEPRLGAQGG